MLTQQQAADAFGPILGQWRGHDSSLDIVWRGIPVAVWGGVEHAATEVVKYDATPVAFEFGSVVVTPMGATDAIVNVGERGRFCSLVERGPPPTIIDRDAHVAILAREEDEVSTEEL